MFNIAWNYMTKGIIYSMPMLKYLIISGYEIITPTRKYNSGGGYGELIDDIHDIGKHDANIIRINIFWKKNILKKKKVTAKLLKIQIKADLLKKYDEKLNDFEVELIEDTEDKPITAELLSKDD